MELIEHPPILHIAAIPDHVLYTWIAMVILVVVAFVASRQVQLVPTGSQNFMEIVLEQFLNELDDDDRARGAALPAADRHPRPLHPGLEPDGARAGAGGADREPQHHRGVRADRVLHLPLDRRPQAGLRSPT